MKKSDSSSSRRPRNSDFIIGKVRVHPGEQKTIDLPTAQLYTHTPLNLPLVVVNGRRTGPVLLITAAIHGDELNGVEIIRRLLRLPNLDKLHGTLVLCPIVNLFGFLQRTRYLPDRRDLNRSFPGSEHGSLAGRIAWRFCQQVVDKCTHIIDLHTGAIHRENLPQIRADLSSEATEAMAKSFGAPFILNSPQREGSLREYGESKGIPVITYEAGEALRFDETAIKAGVRGVIRVMRYLGMLRKSTKAPLKHEPQTAKTSVWTRAPVDGILRNSVSLGTRVRKDDVLGHISDPFGERELALLSPVSGIVIGRSNLPLVNEGEAVFNIARFEAVRDAEKSMEQFQTHVVETDIPWLEDPPIV